MTNRNAQHIKGNARLYSVENQEYNSQKELLKVFDPFIAKAERLELVEELQERENNIKKIGVDARQLRTDMSETGRQEAYTSEDEIARVERQIAELKQREVLLKAYEDRVEETDKIFTEYNHRLSHICDHVDTEKVHTGVSSCLTV